MDRIDLNLDKIKWSQTTLTMNKNDSMTQDKMKWSQTILFALLSMPAVK